MGKLWRVAFAFAVFTIATLLANELGRALGEFILPPSNARSALTFYWFVQTLLPAAAIILLTRMSGDSLGSLYLKRGNLRTGLIIGIGSFLIISLLSFSPPGIYAVTHDPTLLFSLLAPSLLHAGLDVITWLGIFAALCSPDPGPAGGPITAENPGFAEEAWVR